MLLVGLTLGPQPVAPAQATPVLEQADAPRNVTWTGEGNDGRWRNPANWAGQHAPGVRDRVRLTGAQVVWFDAVSPIAGLVLDANFSGGLYLARPPIVAHHARIESHQSAVLIRCATLRAAVVPVSMLTVAPYCFIRD